MALYINRQVLYHRITSSDCPSLFILKSDLTNKALERGKKKRPRDANQTLLFPSHLSGSIQTPLANLPHDRKPFLVSLIEEGIPEGQQRVSLEQGISDCILVLRR